MPDKAMCPRCGSSQEVGPDGKFIEHKRAVRSGRHGTRVRCPGSDTTPPK